MNRGEVEREQWHLDKRIPITLVVMIVVQTAGAVWWASSVTETLKSLDRRISFNEEANRRQWDRITAADGAVQETNARLARVEGLLEQSNVQLSKILDHLIQNR